jgi:hypothetical protein
MFWSSWCISLSFVRRLFTLYLCFFFCYIILSVLSYCSSCFFLLCHMTLNVYVVHIFVTLKSIFYLSYLVGNLWMLFLAFHTLLFYSSYYLSMVCCMFSSHSSFWWCWRFKLHVLLFYLVTTAPTHLYLKLGKVKVVGGFKHHTIYLGGIVVSVHATGPKGDRFKSGWDDGFLRAIKICITPSFKCEVKPEAP